MLNITLWTLIVGGVVFLFILHIKSPQETSNTRTYGTRRKINLQPYRSETKSTKHEALVNLVMRIFVSSVVLLCCLYIILFHAGYSEAGQKWAFSVSGMIVGYWLKT